MVRAWIDRLKVGLRVSDTKIVWLEPVVSIDELGRQARRALLRGDYHSASLQVGLRGLVAALTNPASDLSQRLRRPEVIDLDAAAASPFRAGPRPAYVSA